MKVPEEWLVQRVQDPPTSFGPSQPPISPLRIRMAWQKMRSRAQAHDEIWAFTNPSGRFGHQTGYALVREGRVVDAAVVE